MKKFALLALLTIGSFSAVQAQTSKKATKTTVSKEVKAEGPAITFSSETVDYGTIKKGAEGAREFTFTNTGNKPLIIKNATGSCGCTVPSKPTAPIMPGEKGSIGVKYDTQRTGPFSKTVTVTTNASEKPVVLTIKGNVTAE